MQKPQLFLCLLTIVLTLTSASTQAEPFVRAVPYNNGANVQLLYDTAFHNGFRAFWSCKSFEGDAYLLGHIGNCTDYYTPYVNSPPYGRNYAIRTWPDSGTPNDYDKYWSFTEGIHAGYTDPYSGYTFPLDHRPFGETELSVHRIEANQENSNGVLVSASANLIWLQSINNLSSADPNYGKLVKTVSTDRAGNLMTYMDSRNEIRNVATHNTSQFTYDTWPHFIVGQEFKDLIDLATLNSVTPSVNVDLPVIWRYGPYVDPVTPDPTAFANTVYSVGFTLRRKMHVHPNTNISQNPSPAIFLGYRVHSDWGANLDASFFLDQSGQVSFNGDVDDIGGAIVPGTGPRNVSFELRQLFAKALAGAATYVAANPTEEARRQEFLQTTADDYYIAGFGFGWENTGYQEVQSTVSGVSLVGEPRALFDAEVYEQPSDPNQPSIYKAWNNPGGEYSEGEMRSHWVKYGCWEGRVASTTFDVKVYMDRWGNPGDPGSASYYNTMPQCYNGDGSRNYPCAIVHYVWIGRDAGHPGHW